MRILAAVGVVSHVQRPVGLEAEPALSVAHLSGVESEICEHDIRAKLSLHKMLGHTNEAVTYGHKLFGGAGQVLRGKGEALRVEVNADQTPLRTDRPRQGRAVACAPHGAIHGNITRMRVKQAQRLFQKHGNVIRSMTGNLLHHSANKICRSSAHGAADNERLS